jgi:hypothetical protein
MVPGALNGILMHCLACGAEMNLMNVVVDDSMMVPGFERQTFMCSVCKDIERRFVFNNLGKEHQSVSASPPIPPISYNFENKDIEDDADTESPSLGPGSFKNDQHPATQSLWGRYFAKIRRRRPPSDG